MDVWMAWIDVSMVVPSSVRNTLNIAHSLRKESILAQVILGVSVLDSLLLSNMSRLRAIEPTPLGVVVA